MVIDKGKEYAFVDTDIELKEDEMVKILMKEYIHEVIITFGEPMGKGTNTPTKHNFFTVR